MKMYALFTVIICCVTICTSCATSNHQSNNSEKITVGTVQKEIRVGMSGSEVAAAIGSPNIISCDDQRREVWIYDKISTDIAQSSTGGYATLILLGYNSSKIASSTSQQTLTIIIKFDDDKKVRDFAYHTSRF